MCDRDKTHKWQESGAFNPYGQLMDSSDSDSNTDAEKEGDDAQDATCITSVLATREEVAIASRSAPVDTSIEGALPLIRDVPPGCATCADSKKAKKKRQKKKK
jgi:hypothetical protein